MLCGSAPLSQVKCAHIGCAKLVRNRGRQYHNLCRLHLSDAKPAAATQATGPPAHHCHLGELLKPGCIDPIHTHLTPFQRNAIAAFHAIGMSVEDIAKKTWIDKRTIKKWIDRAHENINLRDEARSGRPPKLKEEEKKLIYDAAKQHPGEATPPTLHHELQLRKLTASSSIGCIIPRSFLFYFPFPLGCSDRTIRRALDDFDLRSHVARRCYPYSAETIRKRLSFAQGYAHWDEIDWAKVTTKLFYSSPSISALMRCATCCPILL